MLISLKYPKPREQELEQREYINLDVKSVQSFSKSDDKSEPSRHRLTGRSKATLYNIELAK